MTEKNKFALVRKPSSAVEKAAPGAKRILSGMVADALALMSARTNAEAEIWFEKGNHHRQSKNYEEALVCYGEAAEQGNVKAIYEVGIFYLLGLGGVGQDTAEAFNLIRRAAGQGNGKALNWLGVCYAEGFSSDGEQEIEIDFAEAYKWFTLAAEQGDANAPSWLKTVRSWMSPEDIVEGERRIQDFRAQKIER